MGVCSRSGGACCTPASSRPSRRSPPTGVAEQVERLAHHALRGEVWDKALTTASRRGTRPGALGLPRGGGLLRAGARALAHLPETRDTREQAIDLRLALARRSSRSGDLGAILAYLREAEALAGALDDPPRLGQVSLFLSSHFRVIGAYDEAIAAGQHALEIAGRGDSRPAGPGDPVPWLAPSCPGRLRRAIACFGQTVASLDGESAPRALRLVVLPACSPVPSSPCAMPSWACLPRAGPSGRKGSAWPGGGAPREPHVCLLRAWSAIPPPRRPARALPAARTGLALCHEADLPPISLRSLRPWAQRIRLGARRRGRAAARRRRWSRVLQRKRLSSGAL